MSFQSDLKAWNRVKNDLRRLATLSEKITNPIMRDWAQSVRRKLKATPYPPKRPNQKYVRTGQLANRWAVQAQGKGKWSIVNRARQKGKFYANYVVGPPDGPIGVRQAWMHRGRWWHAEDVINEEIPRLTEELTEALTEQVLSGR